MKVMLQGLRIALEILVAAALGTAAILAPVLLDRSQSYTPAIFLPFMGAVEHMNAWSIIFLTIVGVILGRLGRAPFWLLGFSTVAFLPIWAHIDLAMAAEAGLDRHNLLWIEWAAYLIISFLPFAGSWAGVVWKRSKAKGNSANPRA